MPAAPPSRRKTRPKGAPAYTPSAAKRLTAIQRRAVLFEKGPVDFPAFSSETEALESYKKNQKGNLRIKKNKETHEVAEINLTTHGKYDQLFTNPARKAWRQYNPAQQDRLFEHYIFTTTRFLTGAQQKTSKHGTHRLTLSEAQEARLPFLEKTLHDLRQKIRSKNDALTEMRISLNRPGSKRPFTREEVDAMKRHVAELENRASIAEGVIEKLRTIDQYGELMERAELGRKKAEKKRTRQPAFSTEAGRRLLALHTRLEEMDGGRMGAHEKARERIKAINRDITRGMKIDDPAFQEIEKRKRNPLYEIIPEHTSKYRRTLHQIKNERRGLLRATRRKGMEEVDRVVLTTKGKFRQLFLTPATRGWETYSDEHRDRLLQHYVKIATKLLTSTKQRIGEESRRMKLDEARAARIPLLKDALNQLEQEIEMKEEGIRHAASNLRGDREFRTYTAADIQQLRNERDGFENRASILKGVISRLEHPDFAPEQLYPAERGRRRTRTRTVVLTPQPPGEKQKRSVGEPREYDPFHPYFIKKNRTALMVVPEPTTPAPAPRKRTRYRRERDYLIPARGAREAPPRPSEQEPEPAPPRLKSSVEDPALAAARRFGLQMEERLIRQQALTRKKYQNAEKKSPIKRMIQRARVNLKVLRAKTPTAKRLRKRTNFDWLPFGK